MPDEKADPGSASGPAPPDPGASTWRVLERLTEAECMELLANGGVGRLVYTSRYGPTALPVAYKTDGESVVLGTWDPALFDEDLRTGITQAEYEVLVEGTRSMRKRARDGSCWHGDRPITWTPNPSARHSWMPDSSRGSREYLRTSSG